MTINAVGDVCPIPVIKTKKALEQMNSGTLEVIVDNEIAVQNIKRLVQSLQLQMRYVEKEGVYHLSIDKSGDGGPQSFEQDPQPATAAKNPVSDTVVVLSSDKMGDGDDTLGTILMKGFLFALTQLEHAPKAVLLYNAGAKLSLEGSASLEDLRALESLGTEILTCGTCLIHYNLQDKLSVGETTNMYQIVELMNGAGRIISP